MVKHSDLIPVASALFAALDWLDMAHDALDRIYNGYDPGYPYADSPDARAWDYYDAISRTRQAIVLRLETWDEYIDTKEIV